jgi:hypothetical protein
MQVPGFIIIEKQMKIKLFCRAILYLFGTFLHEFSHFAAALVFGRPEGFSIAPRIEGDRFIFGEVRARVRYKVLSVFIAAAPIIWWVFLFFIGKHFLFVYHATCSQGLDIKMLSLKLKTCSLSDVFFLWVGTQLLWAGRLSGEDIKACLSGIISLSGIALILLSVFLWHIFR